MIGGLVWPTQFVSKESISVATAPVSVVDEVTPDPAAPQAEVRSDKRAHAAGTAEASPGSTASGQNTSSENPSEISAASPAGLRLSSAAVDERAAGSKSPKPHHRSHQELSPLVNLPSGRLKRLRMTPLTQRSFASFCNGEPRASASPQLLGKTQPRAIIV